MDYKIGNKVTFNILSQEDKDRETGEITDVNEKFIVIRSTTGSKYMLMLKGSLIESVRTAY